MADGVRRFVGSFQRKAKSSIGRQGGQTDRPARSDSQREDVIDRRLVAVVTVVTVALLAISRYSIDPTGPLGWNWSILLLCVLLAATIGRMLIGYQGANEGDTEKSYSSKGVKIAVWLLLLGAATLPNVRTLDIGFLADDFGLIQAGEFAEGPLDVFRLLPLRVFYRPISLLVWWLGIHLWGGSALGYHLFSLLLHTGNTLLLYVLARRYMKSVFGGAMAALLFALHPVHIEATVWASAQPDLLCTGFILLSMWFLERHLDLRADRRRYLSLSASLAAFFFALLSKETAAALLGIVLIRLLVISDNRRWTRVVRVGAVYFMVIVAYLGIRFAVLGRHWLGGYGVAISFWDAVFSPTPTRLAGQLLFPVHVMLFEAVLFPYLWLAAILLMAAGLLWWIGGIVFVSRQRLILYASYLLVPMIPVAVARLNIGEAMASSRYAYIPSVGLALLFGETCLRRRGDWRRGKIIGVAILCVAATLSFWYVESWREAARMRDEILAEGVRIVESLPDSPSPSRVFFTDLPVAHLGAALFVNGCHAAALSPLVGEHLSLQDVGATTAESDVMDATELIPGEYVVAWKADSRRMVIERAGGDVQPPHEVQP